eukprot:2963122-Amphidinium_carterae.1
MKSTLKGSSTCQLTSMKSTLKGSSTCQLTSLKSTPEGSSTCLLSSVKTAPKSSSTCMLTPQIPALASQWAVFFAKLDLPTDHGLLDTGAQSAVCGRSRWNQIVDLIAKQ